MKDNLTKFIQTHDIQLVKKFYTDCVLTPSEVAFIVAKHPQTVESKYSKVEKKGSSRSPFRQRDKSPSDLRKTPTGSQAQRNKFSMSQSTPDKIKTLKEYKQGDDNQLYKELRRVNDKYIEQQVDNRKLKDQVQLLTLQVEDLRLHNNRY